MKKLLLLFVSSAPLWATAYTASVTGTWANPATWGGSGPPVSGDTTTINNGITVTVAANATVGDSANPGTYAIRTAGTGGTGILVVDPGVTLTIKGHILQGNATWTIGTTAGGAFVIFDNTTTSLQWNISDASSQANAKLVVRGALGNRSTFTKSGGGVVGGGFKGLTTSIVDGGRVDADYVDFSDIGSTSVSSFAPRGGSSSFTFSLQHTRLIRCGQITQQGAAFTGDANVILNYFEIESPTVSGSRWADFAFSARTTGTRSFTNIVVQEADFRCNPAVTGANIDITWSNVVVRNATSIGTWNSGCSSARIGTFTNVLQYVASIATGGASVGSVQADGFYMLDETPANGNGHPIQGINMASVVTNWVAEGTNNVQSGDIWQFGHSGAIASENISVRNGVVIQPVGGYYGVIVNHSIPAAHDGTHQFPNITSRNITWRGGNFAGAVGGSVQFGAAGGEGAGNQGKAGHYPAVRNHIVWSETAATVSLITDYFGSSTGATPPANGEFTLADYNNYWNITGDPTDGRYKYSVTTPAVYTATPGVNDVNINPRFPDTTRNFLNWGKSINPSLTTVAQVLDEMVKLADDSGYDPRFNVADLLKWTRWGHVPQEPRLWLAPDGDFYGGVDPTPLKISSAAVSF